MIVATLFIIYYLRKEVKDILLFLLVAIGLYVLSLYTLGWEVTGERELSVILCMGGFVFLPLLLFSFVAKDVNDHPTESSPPLMDKELALKIVATIMLIIAIFFVILGLTGIIAPEIPESILGDNLGGAIAIVGVVIMVIAGFGVVGAIGLYFKINLCRYFVIFVSVLLWFFVFPFAILLFLCRKDVKDMFLTNG
jgi:hypothetical protein